MVLPLRGKNLSPVRRFARHPRETSAGTRVAICFHRGQPKEF
jgi:hypothetical protein